MFSGKSPNLVELSFSLPELWARNLKDGAKPPPPPYRLQSSDDKLIFKVKLAHECSQFL